MPYASALEVIFTILGLLLEKGSEIRALQFGRISLSLTQHFAETTVLEMPKLETVHIGPSDDDWSNDFFSKVLRGKTPTLKQIIYNGENRIFEM